MSRRLRNDPNYKQEEYLAECHEPSVYFVQAGKDGPIKIGHTNNITRRMMNMQQGNHLKLRLLRKRPGSRRDEKAFQDQFAHHRISGEWFVPAQELLDFITNDEKDRVTT